MVSQQARASAAGIEADTTGDARVLRGGSWYGSPDAVRSAERNWNDPSERVDNAGFRLVSSDPIDLPLRG
jgi:formylglycine-generating enzyme required for sulfatase activity